MSKSGKITYKELSDRITMAFTRLMEVHENVTYIHALMLKYIKFNDNEEAFLKFVEEERTKEEAKAREDDSKVK